MQEVLDKAPSRVQVTAFTSGTALALTFLFAGLAYAWPLEFFPESHPKAGRTSSEVLNLYLVVAWMGWAHFIYAYHGQGRSLFASRRPGQLLGFWWLVIVAGVVLALLRHFLGLRIFDGLMWVYFIPHFIRAEVHFLRYQGFKKATGWVVYWFPAACFAFFTVALFTGETFIHRPWLPVMGAIGVVLAGYLGGVFRQLSQEQLAPYAILGFFLLGEGLVWGTYRRYMTPQFEQGVYVFHVAVASFYHYFRSYGFADFMARQKGVELGFCSQWLGIIGINLIVILTGMLVLRHDVLSPLRYVLDLTYFPYWVGLHLVASDLFLWWKKRT